MKQNTPIVCSDYLLHISAEHDIKTIAVGTHEWYDWLEQHHSFSLETARRTFTLRKEQRPGGQYWYAYHRQHGKLRSTYVGTTANITVERLQRLLQEASVPKENTTRHTEHKKRPTGRVHSSSQAHERPLLATKLYPPFLRPNMVIRPRITNLLNTSTHYKLTLLSAPAGFGKTTLLREWLAHHQQANNNHLAIAWLSLDKEDNNATTFWHYIIAALDIIQPGLAKNTLPLLFSAQPIQPQTMLTILLNQFLILNTQAHEIAIIIDDYHLIQNQAIHDALLFLIDHLPTQMHLVIASRTELPLPKARLRAKHELLELRTADLRFTRAEASRFLADTMKLTLPEAAIDVLEERTEGWIAGIQLAALSLREHEDIVSFIASFSGNHRHLLDYLVEEVFALQSQEIQSFLLHTCILDRLCASLCNAITEQDHGQTMLRQLEQKNLFINPLDDEYVWYRYHHLFSEVLQTMLHKVASDWVAELYNKASRWYEQNGQLRKAIDYTLKAKNYEHAAHLLTQHVINLNWTQSETETLRPWLEALPAEMLLAQPQLYILKTWILLLDILYKKVEIGEIFYNEIEARLQEAEQLVTQKQEDQQSQWMRGEIAAISSTLSVYRGKRAQVRITASQAITYLPRENITLRTLVARNLFYHYYHDGNLVLASQMLHEIQTISKKTNDPITLINTMFNEADLQTLQGYLPQARETCRQALHLSEQKLQRVSAPFYIILGAIALEQNELSEAESCLTQGIEHLKQRGDPVVLARGYQELISLYLAQDDSEHAQRILDDLTSFLLTTQIYGYSDGTRQLAIRRAQLYLVQGNISQARSWADTYEFAGDEQIASTITEELITLIHVYLSDHEITRAEQWLEYLLVLARHNQRVRDVLQMRILQSLIDAARGRTRQAVATLIRALELAEPGGYMRVFLNEEPALAQLLLLVIDTLETKQVSAPHTVSLAYVRKLLAACRQPPYQSEVRKEVQTQRQRNSRNPHSPTLSKREHEILHLMAQGLSDHAIAEALVLAESTVKTHARRIYNKLLVDNRTQAVTRARALQLL